MPDAPQVAPKPLAAAPEKLRLLADWFDATRPNEPTEAQDDLRHWADQIEMLVGGLPLCRRFDTAFAYRTFLTRARLYARKMEVARGR